MIAPDAHEPDLPAGVVARFARDPLEGEGPLVGVSAGLAVTRTDLALLAGGDMPELSTAVLFEMLQAAHDAPVEAVALQDGDRFRPLPSVVRVDRAVELSRTLVLEGRRRLRDLLSAMHLAVVDEATWVGLDPARSTLFDVDEPRDLEA